MGTRSAAISTLVLDSNRLPPSLLNSLSLAGLTVIEAHSANDINDYIVQMRPDIVLCPEEVFGKDVRDLLTRLDSEKVTETMPVVLFSESPVIEPGIVGSVAEVLTREDNATRAGLLIRAALRRERSQVFTEAIEFGTLCFDPVRYNLVHGEKIAKLRKLDLCVLGAFFEAPERIWSRELLARMFLRPGPVRTERNVDYYLNRMRRHVRKEIDIDVIRPIRGQGYRLRHL